MLYYFLFSLFIYSPSRASLFPQDSVTDYGPNVNVDCPDLTNFEFVREFTAENQTLNSAEVEYIQGRDTVTKDEWNSWLGDGSQLGYNVSSFQDVLPRVGIAIPGGGLRAAMVGAAMLNGIDSRNDSAKSAGTGGLLQVASYVAALSGGSWVTGSMVFNNFPAFNDLVFGDGNDFSGWLLDLPFVTPDGINLFSDNNQYFYGSILWSVISKANQGIDTSMTDPWSRMISYHFLNQSSRANFFTNDSAHGAGQLWSNIPLIPAFQQFQLPFPMAVADSRPVGSNLTTVLPPEPVVYELTPFEIASYDPNLSAGANITLAGTHYANKRPANGTACVIGFDQAGFIMGSSASLFNQILDFAHNTLSSFSSSDAAGLLQVLSRQLSEVRTRADDVANWPNPFNGVKPDTFEDSNSTWIELIDGSSNQENVPYGPLFVKKRGLDVIVTLESSADDENAWPNGTAPIFTSQRIQSLLNVSHQQFPPIPATFDDFVSTGVRGRPTFFGCDPTDNPPEYPLVLYLPNVPPIDGSNPVSNTATFRLTYTLDLLRLLFEQVHNATISGFVPNANTPDPNYGVCLQCAAIDRARFKTTPVTNRSDICSQCFTQYCYDPADPPSEDELPNRKLQFVDPDPEGLTKLSEFFSQNKFKLIGGLVGLFVALGLLVGGLIWWRKRRTRQHYKAVASFHNDEIPLNRFSEALLPDADKNIISYEYDGKPVHSS